MAMTEVETELDSRYDDIDVDSILARCHKGPITYSKRCLYQAPEFVKRLPSTEEVEEGSTVTFGCKVVGFPNPTVTWYKDDDVIKAEGRAQVDAEESGLHSIKIADVSKCDAGIYKIRASNLEGSSTSMLYIAVKVPIVVEEVLYTVGATTSTQTPRGKEVNLYHSWMPGEPLSVAYVKGDNRLATKNIILSQTGKAARVRHRTKHSYPQKYIHEEEMVSAYSGEKCITRSKLRNRKKAKRARLVACPPLFPAIIERVAEEQKEMKEVELQPESPLTPIYCTISRKEPVMWPTFLGDWAYNADDVLRREEIDDSDEAEDVFDDDESTPTSLTFVSSAYAQMLNNNAVNEEADCHSKETLGLSNQSTISEHDDNDTDNTINTTNHTVDTDTDNVVNDGKESTENTYMEDSDSDISSLKEIHCDKINNNDKDKQFNKNHVEQTKDSGDENKDNSSESEEFCEDHSNQQTDTKQRFVDPETVSVISVHRSYAKGDSTSSMARRSPSPLSRSRNPLTFKKNGRHCGINDNSDVSTLQNMNNERILMRMNNNVSLSSKFVMYVQSLASASTWEDHLIEILVLICGSTFLALYFDLPPSTFVVDILIAMFVKLVLTEVLNDS